MRKLLRNCWFWVFVLLVAAGVTLALWPRSKYPFVVSRETTYLTSPLRADGMVDYVAAADGPYRQGVTDENNAAPLLIRALGLERLSQSRRDRILLALKMDPLGWDESLFVELAIFLIKQPQGAGADKQPQVLSQAHRVARSALENTVSAELQEKLTPQIIAAWLKANEAPLALAVGASKRRQCYIPPPPRDIDGAMWSWYPQWFDSDQLVRALAARGMLKLADGDVEGAWRDILAAFRLVRMFGTVGARFPAYLERYTCRAARAVAASDKLTAAQARSCADDLERMGVLPSLAEWVRRRRLLSLDFVCATARLGVRGAMAEDPWFQRDEIPNVRIDCEDLLRGINKCYNRYEAALREPDYPARDRALGALEGERKALCRRLLPTSRPAGTIGRLLEKLKRRMGMGSGGSRHPWLDVLARDPDGLLLWSLTVPPHEAKCDAIAVVEMRLTKLAFALARYAGVKGEYPPDLAQLEGAYLGSIPQDLFSGGAFRYKRDGKGYLLYSLGLNMTDDSGLEDEDAGKDDVAVRVK